MSLLNHPSLQMSSLLAKLKHWEENNNKNNNNNNNNKNNKNNNKDHKRNTNKNKGNEYYTNEEEEEKEEKEEEEGEEGDKEEKEEDLKGGDVKRHVTKEATEHKFLSYFINDDISKFCGQLHDLQDIRLGMRLARHRAFCKSFALRHLNWFLRQSTEVTCMHDLLSNLASSLALLPAELKLCQSADNKESELDYDVICKHPTCDIALAGCHAQTVVQDFYDLYQSISDLMMAIPHASPLQLMAVRCWCLQFRQCDHDFLHRSQVFKNISKILSKSEREADKRLGESQRHVRMRKLTDVTMTCDIEASSHQQMISSLCDNSTETFWESGDEDRNRSKNLLLNVPAHVCMCVLAVHVDNIRDSNNKINLLTVSSGSGLESLQIEKKIEVDLSFVGWVYVCIRHKHSPLFKANLKGPDTSLRIRQLKVLGFEGDSSSTKLETSSSLILFKNCESETLKVFKLLTSQVFGSLLIAKEETSEDSDDKRNLKEHVVGILFSQCKLTSMQRQICSYILQAIQKETNHHKLSLLSATSPQHKAHCDTYIFELLSLVLALSGSKVGCLFIAQQTKLMNDLLTLLHISSPRVQRQVVLLLRRLLHYIEPKQFADIQSFSFVSDHHPAIKGSSNDNLSNNNNSNTHNNNEHTGVLDVLLVCIVKSLVVQVKVPKSVKSNFKGNETYSFYDFVSHHSPSSSTNWWTVGSVSTHLAESIITLINDLSCGSITNRWSSCTKDAVSEHILRLSALPECSRTPEECLRDLRMWMTLASLCVLSPEHTELLTSSNLNKGDASKKVLLCDNHDDDETAAVISCGQCGSLCSECDRILHLSKKTKGHRRHVFREEKEYLKVDCHEGCGRVKLFWLLALADSRNMKAIVEFRNIFRDSKIDASTSNLVLAKKEKCRFCDTPCDLFESRDDRSVVCGQDECVELLEKVCGKMLECGHACGGIRNEEECLPCLHGCKSSQLTGLKQDADDMCMICFTEALSKAPAIQLACEHVFHHHCCQQVLLSQCPGPRITFNFMRCPICKVDIKHPSLEDLLVAIRERHQDVKNKALMRLEFEGLANNHSITTPGSLFYNDPAGYAMNRYAYYLCSKCHKAYYGGEARCEELVVPQNAENFNASELICGGCSDVAMAQICPKHGTDFLEYKCRYCCSVAVFFCFGTTHFCNACHDDFQRITSIPVANLPQCPVASRARQLEGDQCPLNVVHPSTGKEFALGCGICRNAHTF